MGSGKLIARNNDSLVHPRVKGFFCKKHAYWFMQMAHTDQYSGIALIAHKILYMRFVYECFVSRKYTLLVFLFLAFRQILF